jgi:WD40 repeat protein
VAFTRDGRTLTSCGADGLIRRWDLANPQDRRVIRRPLYGVHSIAFAAGSDRLLVATQALDGARALTIETWDLGQHALLESKQIPVAGTDFRCAFSPDASMLCTLDENGQLTLWDTASGRARRKAVAPEVSIHDVSHSAYFSDEFVSFEADAYISNPYSLVWDIKTGKADKRAGRFALLARLPGSGKILVRTDTGTVGWDPVTDRVTGIAMPKGVNPDKIRTSHDGRFLACHWLYSVLLLDARTLQSEGTLLAHPSDVADVDFSPDDRVLASVSRDGTVKLWDVSMRQELCTLSAAGPPATRYLRFSPSGTRLVSAAWHEASRTSELIIWQTAWPEDPSP